MYYQFINDKHSDASLRNWEKTERKFSKTEKKSIFRLPFKDPRHTNACFDGSIKNHF